jgi:outer membrane protein assembly factor BamB
MQPFDDRLPAESDPQNEEILAFLRQSYGISSVIAAGPEPQQKAQALDVVRQRLLKAQQAYRAEESEQRLAFHLLPSSEQIPETTPINRPGAKPARRRWGRGMALLAAALCVALLVGSLLTVFGLIKRGTQPGTVPGTQALYIVTRGWLQKVDARTGVPIWQAQIPYEKSNVRPPINFPLVGNGSVYITSNNSLLAFNEKTGVQLWSVQLTGGSAEEGGQFVQPVFADGRLYYTLQQYASNSNQVSFHIDAFDASSGRVLWHYQPAGSIDGIAVSNNTVYVTFEKWSVHNSHNISAENDLTALNAADGSQKWSAKTGASPVRALRILNGDSEMVVENGIVYQLLSSAACGGKNGSCLFAWRADTGASLWHSQNLVPAAFTQDMSLFQFTGGLIAAGNALYIDSIDGLFALDASNGRVLWQQSEGSLLPGEPTKHELSQPLAGKGNPGNAFVVVGNTIFRMEMTRQGDYLTRLNTSNGAVLSRQRVEDFYSAWAGEAAGYPANQAQSFVFRLLEGLMTGSTSYVFPFVGHLDALDNQTGKRLWSLKLLERGPAVLTAL